MQASGARGARRDEGDMMGVCAGRRRPRAPGQTRPPFPRQRTTPSHDERPAPTWDQAARSAGWSADDHRTSDRLPRWSSSRRGRRHGTVVRDPPPRALLDAHKPGLSGTPVGREASQARPSRLPATQPVLETTAERPRLPVPERERRARVPLADGMNGLSKRAREERGGTHVALVERPQRGRGGGVADLGLCGGWCEGRGGDQRGGSHGGRPRRATGRAIAATGSEKGRKEEESKGGRTVDGAHAVHRARPAGAGHGREGLVGGRLLPRAGRGAGVGEGEGAGEQEGGGGG